MALASALTTALLLLAPAPAAGASPREGALPEAPVSAPDLGVGAAPGLPRAFDAALPIRPLAVPATPFAQRDVSVQGLRLRYIDEGRGAPLLLIPGHTSRVEEYDALVARLKGGLRVLVADLPGSGYSDKPERDYGLTYYEDALLGFLDAMDLPKVSVAGGSQGGNLALRLAARAPERVERVVAWSPGSAWEARPWAAAAIRLVGGKSLFWPVVTRQSKYWYAPGWPGAPASLESTFAYYREIMSPGFLRMYWGIAADTVGTSLFPLAPRIKAPTLLLGGALDPTPGMAAGLERLRRTIPGARLQVYPETGHALASERPAELSEAILAFLRR